MPSLPMDHEGRDFIGGGGGGTGPLGIIRDLIGQGYTFTEIRDLLAGLNTSDAGGSGVGAITPFNPTPFLPGLIGGNRESIENMLLQIAAGTARMDAAQRNALFSALLPALLPFLQEGGEGFSPDALAAMRAEAIDTTAGQIGGARRSLNTELARRGLRTGSNPLSGEGARRIAELDTAGGIETARALREVTTKNEQQRLQNMFNAFNIASGFPSNPSAAINAATNIPEQRPGLGQTLLNSLLGTTASAAGQAIGQALGGIFNRSGRSTSSGGISIGGGNTGVFGTPPFFP